MAAAALTYFDKSLDELTLGEAAFARRVAEGAQPLQPGTRPRKQRRPAAIGSSIAWSRTASSTQAEATQAEAQPLELHHRQEAEQVSAPYFAEEVRRELLARYGEKVLYGAGLSVRTSLDERLQAASDKALARRADRL